MSAIGRPARASGDSSELPRSRQGLIGSFQSPRPAALAFGVRLLRLLGVDEARISRSCHAVWAGARRAQIALGVLRRLDWLDGALREGRLRCRRRSSVLTRSHRTKRLSQKPNRAYRLRFARRYLTLFFCNRAHVHSKLAFHPASIPSCPQPPAGPISRKTGAERGLFISCARAGPASRDAAALRPRPQPLSASAFRPLPSPTRDPGSRFERREFHREKTPCRLLTFHSIA